MLARVPKVPLSALVFYVSVFLLWQAGLIPSPTEIIGMLEELYRSYGLPGLFAASFLEGIVYLGLYFPGSFVVALAVVLSDGSFISLISISLVVAAALTLTALINYILGRNMGRGISPENARTAKRKRLSKGFLLACVHPNALAFYFFNSGIERKGAYKIALVPIVMIPYGFVVANALFLLKEPLKQALESPYLMISFLLIWIVIATLFAVRNKKV
jgi:membrane protein YqaA with SNARE-associated domain